MNDIVGGYILQGDRIELYDDDPKLVCGFSRCLSV